MQSHINDINQLKFISSTILLQKPRSSFVKVWCAPDLDTAQETPDWPTHSHDGSYFQGFEQPARG
jgi:hypothetical protein